MNTVGVSGSEKLLPVQPRLRAKLTTTKEGGVELHTATGVLDVEATEGVESAALVALLRGLDGNRTVQELGAQAGMALPEIREVLLPAMAWGLVDDGASPAASSALAALSRLESVFDRMLEELIFPGPFWNPLLHAPETLSERVYYGFALENWHFVSRENEFDSAVLALADNAGVRAMLNDFYHEEHRHDDILVHAFAPLGITSDDLVLSRPLPATTGLIKTLSWWARTDPLFFLATIGVLEGRLDSESEGADGKVAYDAFLYACDKVKLNPEFVEPLRSHARLNAEHDHGSVSRAIFALIPGIDSQTEARWTAKANVFMEAYAAFFNGIVSYYNDPVNPLLRTVSI